MFSLDDYGQALASSFLFYEAQRSGVLPATNRIPWRRNSALGDATARYDANNNGQLESNETLSRDLAGGYYDAGDRMKYAYPLASSLTLLSWGATQYQGAYEAMGQLDEALDAIKWGTDWLLKAHETTGTGASLQTVRLWGQVGRTSTDHNNISDDQNIALPRPAYFINASKPGSDLAAEVAASFASASILFRATDSAYADQLLNHAQALYKFAYQYQGRYSNVITDTAYPSSNYNDDLAWGAVWLHKAIKSVNGNINETFSWAGNQTYLQIAKSKNLGLGNWTQTWGDKEYGTAVLIAQEDPSYDKTGLENWLNYWTEPGTGHIAYSPGGLAFLSQWGSLRSTANTAFLAAVYSDTVRDYNGRYANFAQSQIDYMLGDNPRNSSYLVGFGSNYSRNPHHANAHLNYNPAYNGSNGWTVFNSNTPNYNLLTGALVGGPGSANDFDYQDNRLDYVRNEVALDYNAAFTGVLAYLVDSSSTIVIEAVGNTQLLKDSGNKYFVQGGSNTPVAIKNGTTHIYQGIYSGWQTLAAETVNGVNQVLWASPGTNTMHVWVMNSDWTRTSTQNIGSLTSGAAYTQETIFGVDANGDGAIGIPPTAVIEAVGNTQLFKDGANKYFAQVGSNTPVAIKNGTTHIYQGIYSGWQTLAAETVNGVNQVLWASPGTNTMHVWVMNSDWTRTSTQNIGSLTSGAALAQETVFGVDANGDGIIGSLSALASAEGNTLVVRFGESTTTALDRISDFVIGADKIDLLTQGGAALNAPVAFTRATDSATTKINTIVTNVFADADGATAGNQALELDSATLVKANTATYLIVNDGTAGFQSANDLVINFTGITGTLPALGTIPVANFFV
jgi:endoglucanase